MGKHAGLSKLKYYCQACHKQCRDEHGFQLHNASLSHVTKSKEAGLDSDQYKQKQKWSSEFEIEFLKFFNGYKSQVPINRVYNDFIKDSSHTHMSATRWTSLTSFTQYLQRKKKVVIIATEPELIVERVDLEAQARTQRIEFERKQQADERSATQRAIAACIETTHEISNETTHETAPQTVPQTVPRTVPHNTQEPQEPQLPQLPQEPREPQEPQVSDSNADTKLSAPPLNAKKPIPTKIGFKLKSKPKSNSPVKL